jgi:hypothetical protein
VARVAARAGVSIIASRAFGAGHREAVTRGRVAHAELTDGGARRAVFLWGLTAQTVRDLDAPALAEQGSPSWQASPASFPEQAAQRLNAP